MRARLHSSLQPVKFAAGTGLVLAALLASAAASRAQPPAPSAGLLRLAVPPLARNAAVFGKDDRIPLPAAHKGFKNQVGLLYEPRTHSVCTAFCVGNDIVATAAHCLFRIDGEKPLPLTKMWFRLGVRSPKSQTRIAGADAGAAAQNIMAGSMRLNVRPPIDAGRDWALVRLARPVCTAGGLKFASQPASEIARLDPARPVYQIAFHRDFRNWELALSPCVLNPPVQGVDPASLARDFSQADQLVLHTCDSGGASSGSPLLVSGPSGFEVAGINVGTYVQSKILMQNNEVVRRFRPDEIANTGVSAAQIAPRLMLFSQARIVNGRTRMLELQTLLEKAGFPSGTRDGQFGSNVKAAIEDYERAQRLAVTGLPTEALMRALGGSAAPAPRTVAVRRAGGARRSVARPVQDLF